MLLLVVSALLGVVCTATSLPMLERLQLLDVPNERSTHRRPIVRGAGIGPFVAALVALLGFAVMVDTARSEVLLLAGSAAILGGLGLVDDLRRGLPIRVRLGGQLLVGVVVGVAVGPHGALVVVATAVCALWVASVVNAFNFMDGIDGITSVTAAVIGVAYAVLGTHAGTSEVVAAGGAVIAGASLGFLPFNFPTARVFLGDVGSYFIGGWCAVLAVLALAADAPVDAVGLPFALYLADTGLVLVGRVVRGEPVGEPHRQHVYQRLVDAGVAAPRVTCFVGLLTASLACLGLLPFLAGTSRTITVPVGIVLLTGYLASPRLVHRRLRQQDSARTSSA